MTLYESAQYYEIALKIEEETSVMKYLVSKLPCVSFDERERLSGLILRARDSIIKQVEKLKAIHPSL